MWKHIIMFDCAYPKEKQAEGIAVAEAVANGKCNKCRFLRQCESSENFHPPVSAWCMKRKTDILKK